MDQSGAVVHEWVSDHNAGNKVELAPDGSLWRLMCTEWDGGCSGGYGCGIQRFAWNGTVLWNFTSMDDATNFACQGYSCTLHHDLVLRSDRGTILVVIDTLFTADQARAAGRAANESMRMDGVVELRPTGYGTADVVWEWHVWDHLVQDVDATLDNYAADSVAAHPERIDINCASCHAADFNHMNGIDYHAGLDQLMISLHAQSELAIVDRATTSAEAASRAGGRAGAGGDLLYRWGHPAMYGANGSQQVTIVPSHFCRFSNQVRWCS